MRELLTVLSYIIIFALVFKRALDTGVIDGSVALLLVPFLVNTGIDNIRDSKAALRYCKEDKRND